MNIDFQSAHEFPGHSKLFPAHIIVPLILKQYLYGVVREPIYINRIGALVIKKVQ